MAEELQIKAGDFLFREGDVSYEIYIVVRGKFKILKRTPTGEVEIGSASARQLLGEMTIAETEHRAASAVAEVDSVVLSIKNEGLQKYLKTQPAWLSALIESLSSKLRFANKKIADLQS